jgi:HSP20 family protein
MNLMKRPSVDTPFRRLRNEIDRLFDRRSDFGAEEFFDWAPAVDVMEDKDKVTVKAELPGFKREDINVSLHENNLVITGERRCEDEQKGREFYRCERYYGKFHREISLPSLVDAEKIDAKYRDGVLTVKLPKTEKAKGKQIEVAVE